MKIKKFVFSIFFGIFQYFLAVFNKFSIFFRIMKKIFVFLFLCFALVSKRFLYFGRFLGFAVILEKFSNLCLIFRFS